MILVISHAGDDHATGVLDALRRIGHPAVLLDTASFPRDACLTQRFGPHPPQFSMNGRGPRIDFAECRVAWWRRPQPFTLDDGIDPATISFAYTECHEAVGGLWAALELRWVNPPALDELAHHKPYQLAAATAVGLTVPRTVITNDPEAARELIEELGPERTVYKTFLATEDHWRETRVVRPDELQLLDRVRLAPVIFQEFVPASADLRVTVMGELLFATAIAPAPGGYSLDYRMDIAGAAFAPTELPRVTVARLQRLMRRLGLVYGAIDLRLTPDGEYVFLEINPAGEWRFVEERTGQPLTETMASLLAAMDAC